MTQNILKYIKFLLPSILITLFFSYSFSAVLSLQKIGSLDLEGKVYPEWWYTGSSPILYGTAEAGTNVVVKIGENTFSAIPDTSGNWTYGTQLESGDHLIEISQGIEKLTFTLHLGQTMPQNSGTTVTSGSQVSGVPDTGSNQYVALSFGLGLVLLSTYFYFSSDNKKKSIFETRMLKED